MKLKIERNLLLTKLNVVSHALASKTPLPVLTAVKIDVTDEGVTLIASTGEISIRTKLNYDELQIEETGSVAVSGKMFCDIIRTLKSPDIEIFTEDSVLRIKAGRGNYKLNLMDVSSYPNINFDVEESDTVVNFTGAIFNNMVKNVIISAAQSEKKPILTGVNFSFNEGKLTSVATDSFRLSRMEVENVNCTPFTVTIPNSSLNELLKCISDSDELKLIIFKNSVVFKFNDVDFIARIIDAPYPNTSKLIGNEFELELEVNREELLNASDRIMILSPSGAEKEREITYNVMGLRQTSEISAVLEITNNVAGEAREEINISVLNSKIDSLLDIDFSGKYFIDALRSFKSEKIQLKFNGPMRPFIIQGADDKGLVQLILPVRK